MVVCLSRRGGAQSEDTQRRARTGWRTYTYAFGSMLAEVHGDTGRKGDKDACVDASVLRVWFIPGTLGGCWRNVDETVCG